MFKSSNSVKKRDVEIDPIIGWYKFVIISISLFGVMGDYLSIYGDGKYLYLVVSFILLSIIYYYMMNSKKELFFAVVCYISQIISVILLVILELREIFKNGEASKKSNINTWWI